MAPSNGLPWRKEQQATSSSIPHVAPNTGPLRAWETGQQPLELLATPASPSHEPHTCPTTTLSLYLKVRLCLPPLFAGGHTLEYLPPLIGGGDRTNAECIQKRSILLMLERREKHRANHQS